MITLAAAWTFPSILELIIWGLMILLNVWVYQKTKAKGNMLMIVGAGCLALTSLLMVFNSVSDSFTAFWLPTIGAGVLLAGYYFTVQPMVQAHVDALKQRVKEATASKEKPAEDKPAEGGGEASS